MAPPDHRRTDERWRHRAEKRLWREGDAIATGPARGGSSSGGGAAGRPAADRRPA